MHVNPDGGSPVILPQPDLKPYHTKKDLERSFLWRKVISILILELIQ